MKRTISVSEMASYCQVTAETIRRWIDSGAIAARRTLGGHRRVAYEDFIKFLDENQIPIERKDISSGAHVLVVGAKPKIQETMNSIGQEIEGDLRIDHVPDSFEAGYKIAQETPDAIVFCVDTPGMNVYRACKLIREDPGTRTSTIIAMCTSKQDKQVNMNRSFKPDHLLEHPLDPRRLRILLQYL
jgi:excisionase family DNA binding protein